MLLILSSMLPAVTTGPRPSSACSEVLLPPRKLCVPTVAALTAGARRRIGSRRVAGAASRRDRATRQCAAAPSGIDNRRASRAAAARLLEFDGYCGATANIDNPRQSSDHLQKFQR